MRDTIEWTNDLKLNIDVIDEQHKQIVDYINELGRAIDDNNEAMVKKITDNVINYTVDHFNYEESLMEKAKYESFDEHCKKHVAFKQAVALLHAEMQADNALFVAEKLRLKLKVWLIQHIKHEDFQYEKAVGHLFRKKSFLGGIFNFFGSK